jgi:hypothetical protein
MKHLLFILSLISISSCAYKTGTLTSTEGKKVKVRYYKDDNKQKEYENTATFKRVYTPMTFKRHAGLIAKDSFENYIYFEFDTVRIYIDKNLTKGIDGAKYSTLLESGILSPSIIFCALDSLCRPQQDSSNRMITIGNTRSYSNNYDAFDSAFILKRYNWSGLRISISDIEELPYLEKNKTRVFKFEHKIYYGGPRNAFYFFEITNDSANKKTSFIDFIKGGRLTFIKHTWTGMEI